MAYELLRAEKEELHLCFRLSGEAAERCGAIGYLRADFGRSGKEFYTTWFDNQAHLKSPDFKYKFDELINSLRDDGQKPPFASRENHLAFCAAHPSMTCFKIATLDYSFYVRLNPNQGTYDIYCFAYDNRSIHRAKNGYFPCDSSKPDPEANRLFADTSNKIFGITRAQEEAMLAGSMFGWGVPGAKPWHYDQNGKPHLPNQPKKNSPER